MLLTVGFMESLSTVLTHHSAQELDPDLS